jgi:hypothetical protein
VCSARTYLEEIHHLERTTSFFLSTKSQSQFLDRKLAFKLFDIIRFSVREREREREREYVCTSVRNCFNQHEAAVVRTYDGRVVVELEVEVVAEVELLLLLLLLEEAVVAVVALLLVAMLFCFDRMIDETVACSASLTSSIILRVPSGRVANCYRTIDNQ